MNQLFNGKIKEEETNMIIFEILGLLTFMGITVALASGLMWLIINGMVNLMVYLERRGDV